MNRPMFAFAMAVTLSPMATADAQNAEATADAALVCLDQCPGGGVFQFAPDGSTACHCTTAVAPPGPYPHPYVRVDLIEAGPIWNQAHAEQVCPEVCDGGAWTGGWNTTQQGVMSVCECQYVRP